jgi:signal transduction histidine kinase
MILRRLNTIATRFALTIILAIILGIALEVIVGFTIAYIGARYGRIGDLVPRGSNPQAVDRHARVIASPSGIFVFTRFGEPVFAFNIGRNRELLASKIATLMQVVATVSQSDRANIAAAISAPNLQVAVRDAPVSGLSATGTADLDLVRQLIEYQIGDKAHHVAVGRLPASDPPVETGESRHADSEASHASDDTLFVQKSLDDGRWLVITMPHYGVGMVSPSRMALVLSPLFVLFALLSIAAGRKLAAPIRHFADAAERLGVDSTMPPLAERGPYELRTAIRAFNRMQERLRRFVDDRTQMLAAMSHDLRTPLNRMRLRAEFIEDAEQQRKMFADLEAMNVMIDTTLAFARDDARREPRKLVDLGILVEDVCEDLADAGGVASYSGSHGVNVQCRPTAISRAVANLIENAMKYAGAARVHLARESDHVVITVEDDGPGIPTEQHEKVFAPFYRLEPSRNQDTGGVGLGLSVARTIAREHGGDIVLANRRGGGLCARMELPA